MYKEITLPINDLYNILTHKRARDIYIKLLQQHITQDDEDSYVNHIVIDSYQKDCKKYGYKTKSGLWKAIEDLCSRGGIDIYYTNNIFLRGCKLVL